MPPEFRAPLLERAADLLEARRAELIALAVREAGKSLPNAIAEVREAVDFCRYYAQQMRSQFARRPTRGARAGGLHQPMEFSAGDLHRPGERRAGRRQPGARQAGRADAADRRTAVRLLHEAGIPRAALQFLPGRGETVGAGSSATRACAA